MWLGYEKRVVGAAGGISSAAAYAGRHGEIQGEIVLHRITEQVALLVEQRLLWELTELWGGTHLYPASNAIYL